MTPRLYIFDADNTLRRTRSGRPCPLEHDDWELLPGVAERLRAIPWSASGPYLAIASNQDQVGYGILPARRALELLEAMVVAAVGSVTPPPCISLCPHRPDEGCRCRKPGAEMLLRSMRHFGVAPQETIFVGDAATDRLAARRARVGFRLARRFFAG